jgi:hypothetical protein
MAKLIDVEKGGGLLTEHLKAGVRSVLIPFWHGVGDVVMFLPLLEEVRRLYPGIRFDIGLCRGLDQESFVPEAVLLDGDWREKIPTMEYDIVFPCNFPIEDLNNPGKTKAEVCCERELGIVPPPTSHLPILARPLVGVHFQITSVPWVANADEPVAKQIWEDIKSVNCTPIETHYQHVFHNPANVRYEFVDNHVRACGARLHNLMSMLRACTWFVGVVSGNFHLALSILGPQRVLLLEKDLKAGHFTKWPIATANLKDYKGEVGAWLKKQLI